MFDILKSISYNDATEIVYYAIREIRNPNKYSKKKYKNTISEKNKKYAQSIIDEAQKASKDGLNESTLVNDLYNILIDNAAKQIVFNKDNGKTLLEKILKKNQMPKPIRVRGQARKLGVKKLKIEHKDKSEIK